MCSNKANIYDLKLILHGDDQSIAIAFNIEHNPVVSQDAGSTVGILNISGASPFGPFCFGVPGSERVLAVRMFLPE